MRGAIPPLRQYAFMVCCSVKIKNRRKLYPHVLCVTFSLQCSLSFHVPDNLVACIHLSQNTKRSSLFEEGGHLHVPAALPPDSPRYPLDRIGGPHSQSGHCWWVKKQSVPLSGIELLSFISYRLLNVVLCGIALGCGLDDRRFEARLGLGIFLLTTAVFRSALGPTQPPMQWVSVALSPRG
jgi:hypothetical protein